MPEPSAAANETRCRAVVNQRSLGLCEIRIPNVCLGRGDSIHHRFKPGRIWLPANCVKACGDGTRGCHGWVEHHPAEANERGLWLYPGQIPLETSLIIAWRGIIDWYYLDNRGGIRWPGYDPADVPPALT